MEVNMTSYNQLVRAIENATNYGFTSYKINLLPGDYNATTSMTLEESDLKNIIINGNNNTLDGRAHINS